MKIDIDVIKQKLIDNNKTDMEIETILNRIQLDQENKSNYKLLNKSTRQKIRELLTYFGIDRNDYRVYYFFYDHVTALVIRKHDCVMVSFSFVSPEDVDCVTRREGLYNALLNYTKNVYTYCYPKCQIDLDSISYAKMALKDHINEFPGLYNKLKVYSVLNLVSPDMDRPMTVRSK